MLITVSNLKQPKRPSAEEFINTQKHTLNYYSVMKEDKLHTRVDESYEHNWAMTNLDGILKSRNITLPTKLSRVKAVDFPVVMHGCESWTIKKAEHWRTDASELWCWRKLLRVPWTAWRSNQLILKEFNPEYSLEGLTSKLKLQYFGHLFLRADSLEKTLMLGQIEGRRRSEQ